MFIKSKSTYLLLENIKQAKNYLAKNTSVDFDDSDEPHQKIFKDIVNRLRKLPNLVYTFIKLIYESDKDNTQYDIVANYEEAERLIEWVINNKNITNQLPKNITEYQSLEELTDDITQLESKRKVNKFYKSLYSSMRNQIDQLSDTEYAEFSSLAEKFMDLSKEHKKQFTPLKFFENNNVSIHEFLEILSKFVGGTDVNEEKDRVYKYIKENDLDVVYDDNNVIVIKTKDKDAVCELGSQKWCIVYSEHFFNSYIKDKKYSTQYIIYNFNLPVSNPNSMFGITLKPNGEPLGSGASQNKLNNYIPLNQIYDSTGIPKGTIISDYKDLYDEKNKEVLSYLNDGEIDKVIEYINQYDSSDNGLLNISYSDVLDMWCKKYDNLTDFTESLMEQLEENESVVSTILTNVFSINNDYITEMRKKLNVNHEYHVSCTQLSEYLSRFDLDTLIIKMNKLSKYFSLLLYTPSMSLAHLIINKCNKDENKIVETIILNSSLLDSTSVIFEKDAYGIENKSDIKLSFVNYIILYAFNSLTINKVSYIYTPEEINEGILNIKNRLMEIFDNTDIFDKVRNKVGEYVTDILFPDLRGNFYLEDKTFQEYIDIYDSLKHIFYEDEDDDYTTLLEYIVRIITAYSDKPKEVISSDNPKYSLDYYIAQAIKNDIEIYEKDIDVTENEDYIRMLGETMIKYDIESNDNLFKYAKQLEDSSYTDDFMESIGLVKDEEQKVWYMLTTYKDLEEYYNTDNYNVDLEDYWEMFDSGFDDYDYHDDCFDDIDINNLKLLAKYFKENNFNIDLSPLEKYENEYTGKYGNITLSYEKCQEFYREDKDLRSLLSDVEDIVRERYDVDEDGEEINPYDNIDIEDIQNNFNRAYSSANNDARADEWWNNTVGNLDKIFRRWPDKDDSFGSDILKWNTENEMLRVIPDIWNMLEPSLLPIIAEYESLSVMTVDNIIDAYLDSEGKIDPGRDDGYANMRPSNYEHFNEKLGWDLDDIIPRKTNENIIKYSDYVLEDKELKDIPQHFVSEFEDEERAKEELEYYNNQINDLNKNGGQVYRLVFLEDTSELDKDDLGEHWCLEQDQLSNFYDSLKGDNEGNPYLIIGYLEPNQIDEESSYGAFGVLPHELEVNLKSDPIKYKVVPYRGTSDADRMWDNILL